MIHSEKPLENITICDVRTEKLRGPGRGGGGSFENLHAKFDDSFWGRPAVLAIFFEAVLNIGAKKNHRSVSCQNHTHLFRLYSTPKKCSFLQKTEFNKVDKISSDNVKLKNQKLPVISILYYQNP